MTSLIWKDFFGKKARKLNSQITIATSITQIYDNHIKLEVSLHFWAIWPTVWQWSQK